MDEHVEAGLAGVLAQDVRRRQVEQGGVQLRADGVHQRGLPAPFRT